MSNHIADLQVYDKKDVYGKIGLIQLGRNVLSCGEKVHKHTHLNWFELTCIVEGEGEIFGGDKYVNVKKGDIYLSFPCEVHGITSSGKNSLIFDHFAFYTTNEDYKETFERVMTMYSGAEKRVFRSYLVREMLDGCINLLLKGGDFVRDYFTASFSLIVLELLKTFEVKKSSGLINDEISQDPEKLCSTIKHYIDTHLFSIESLTELSSLCGYNYSYLSFLFRKVSGITLSDYYKNRRFESAKLMIRENRLKIGEISNLLGYNSVYAFSKAFKDEFGMSPKNYYKSVVSRSPR